MSTFRKLTAPREAKTLREAIIGGLVNGVIRTLLSGSSIWATVVVLNH